jgi:type IV pilus assembly protein PilC
MARFHWKGFVDSKRMEGDIDAMDETQAKMLLAQQHVTILELKASSSTTVKRKGGRSVQAKKGKVPEEQLLVLLKKFSSMINAGLPVLEALSMLKDQASSPALLYVLNDIYHFVERGNPVSNAFARHPEVFDSVFINLLRAGEVSGKFDFFLERLVASVEKGIHIRKSVKKALFYPTILLTVATAVVTIMLVKVVPVFVDMYRGMGGELPAATRIVVAISEWLRSPEGGGLMLVTLLFSVVTIRVLSKRKPAVRRAIQRLMLRTPVAGELIVRSSMSKISLVLGNLHVAGVSINNSLEITRDSIGNLLVQEALENMKRGVLAGRPLSEMANEQEVFPLEFSQLLAVGEKTGKLGEMLEGMEKYYQEEFDNSIQNMTALIEPIMIVFLGVVIGGILMAMYMPIFNMGQMMR